MSPPGFPCLLEFPSGQRYPLTGGPAWTVGGRGADVPLAGLADAPVLFRLSCTLDGWWLKPGDASLAVRVNGVEVRRAERLQHLTLIQADSHLLAFVAQDDPRMASADAANRWLIGGSHSGSGAAALSGTSTQILPVAMSAEGETAQLPGSILLRPEPMLIGRDPRRAAICLPDIRVSRVHAWISRTGNAATVRDANSANGTYLDGQRLRGSQVIREGSEIRIGPYQLIFTGTALYPLSRGSDAQLVARDLTCRVPDSSQPTGTRTILDRVSLVVRPREFVCILGPSGCGKSTLLSALSGRRPPDEGQILLNGEDLVARFESLKHNLAVVPQREVLHDVLPLGTALTYTARLRLPADTSRAEIDHRVSEMLAAVRLTEHRLVPIRRLSGGQHKRASWVNESICNPSLIFLDEVTSGLDEQTDREMMELFRSLADAGKTIVCVTHRTGQVERYCHLLVILAAGGVLAFVGTPAEALEHFHITRLADVYQRLEEQQPPAWQDLVRGSRAYERYVTARLPEPLPAAVRPAPPARRLRPLRNPLRTWQQGALLVRRYAAIQWAEKRALALMLGQSLLIAGLLSWLFQDVAQPDARDEARQAAHKAFSTLAWSELLPEDQAEFLAEAVREKRAALAARLLFLLTVSCIWFGCNNAAKEIVKERAILRRERDAGLRVLSYYGSKLALLALLSVGQAALLYACVRGCTGLPGDAWRQVLLLAGTALSGVGLGLALSALATSEDVAVTLVPLSLIPQVVMAGLIAPLSGAARSVAQLGISAYWGYQGLVGSLDEACQTRLRAAGALDLGREWNLARVSSVLALHLAAFAVVAIVAICLRDERDNRRLSWFRRKRAVGVR